MNILITYSLFSQYLLLLYYFQIRIYLKFLKAYDAFNVQPYTLLFRPLNVYYLYFLKFKDSFLLRQFSKVSPNLLDMLYINLFEAYYMIQSKKRFINCRIRFPFKLKNTSRNIPVSFSYFFSR